MARRKVIRPKGVCKDFAHLAIGCLRSPGLPARYVSGYIETLPPPGQQKLEVSDASHAWFTVAWGRDYGDVTPLKGVVINGGGSHGLMVSVGVRQLSVS